MNQENSENQTLQFQDEFNNSPKKKSTDCFGWVTNKIFLIFFFILIAFTVPIIIYFITINIVIETGDIHYTCAVDDVFKIPCGRVNISKNDCLQINCCFDDQRFNCFHFMPSKYNYITENGDVYNSLQPKTPYSNNSIWQLKLSIIEIDSNRLKIIVHELPQSNSTATVQNKTYNVEKHPQFLGVRVFRQDTKEMILSTLMGPLIASDHYWEWTIYLVNDHIFGLGDIVFPKNKTLTKVIYKNKNDHNTLPNFMVYLNGSFYGILVEHDGPLEVTVFPGRIISLKSLAGHKIAINIYTGPTIQKVIEQMRFDGTTYSVPYWALGIHICRDGLTTIDDALKEFGEFYSTQKDIHYASDCVHENLYNLLHQVKPEHGLPTLITSLQQEQTKFIMSMPPQVFKVNEILYNYAVELNILYTNASADIFHGIYNNEEVVYPDYTHRSIGKWFEKVKLTLPVTKIDGFVLRDNWPQEDVYIFRDPEYEFPYMTDNLNNSISNTIHWNASSFGDSLQPHILHHNSYGTAQLSAFRNFTNYEFILTSSSSAGVFEPIAIQNVNVSWTNLKKAVTASLYNGMFGNYMTSIPVCGSTSVYNSKTNDELCLRWYITSATFPMFRISSDFPRRDPSNLSSGFSKNTVKDVIKKRHMLLPYFYTILYAEAPLVRPMIYSFHKDNVTWNLDEQYMLGDALLVVQPFLAAVTKVVVYLPPAINVWYEFWGGNAYKNGWNSINIVKNDWIMFMSEGHIIPLRHHKSPQIGAYTSSDSFGFAVALKCTAGKCYAEGLLQLNTAQLQLTADRTGIIINNLSEAKIDIGCNLVEPNYPKYVENMMIYGISETVLHSNSSVIDLCTVSESSVHIPYFVQ